MSNEEYDESAFLMNQPVNGNSKKIHVQDRALSIGNFVIINSYRVNLSLLKQRFAEGGVNYKILWLMAASGA